MCIFMFVLDVVHLIKFIFHFIFHLNPADWRMSRLLYCCTFSVILSYGMSNAVSYLFC